MRKVSAVIRANAEEFALINSLNCGNPLTALRRDIGNAAAAIDYFAGLVLQVHGSTIPLGEDVVNMTVREPVGVVGRIVAYNHPFAFTAAKFGAVLGAGCTMVVKAAYQAPLSAYRLMELIDGILPPGVVNVITGGVECGQAMVAHPLIAKMSPRGQRADRARRGQGRGGPPQACGARARRQECAGRLSGCRLKKAIKVRHLRHELLLVWPVLRIDVASLWCTRSVYDEVLKGVVDGISKIKPGNPLDENCQMGALISKAQFDKVMSYVEIAKKDGARLMTGGKASG